MSPGQSRRLRQVGRILCRMKLMRARMRFSLASFLNSIKGIIDRFGFSFVGVESEDAVFTCNLKENPLNYLDVDVFT